jgi:hypothetical protein
MATSIERSFVKQFEREVHEAYQRVGSKLRPTLRSKNNVKGASTTFQKVGKGTAGTKVRHGEVPVMNLDHEPVECILYDFYAGEWIDKLDELKTNTDERSIVSSAGAYALGRKTDDLVIAAMQEADQIAGSGAVGLVRDKVLEAFEMLGSNDVPDDGQRYAIVGWRQWSDLLSIKEFASADYLGTDELPWNGTQAKRWLGTLWMPHSGLPVVDGQRQCFWYHKTAVGHAAGADVETDISWHGDRAAHFVNSMMSQGAVLIDPSGVIAMPCAES